MRRLRGEWERAKNFNYKLVNFERFTGVKLAARGTQSRIPFAMNAIVRRSLRASRPACRGSVCAGRARYSG